MVRLLTSGKAVATIQKKYVDQPVDLRANKPTSEFHCSRTWFNGEKPVKFKKLPKSTLQVGGAVKFGRGGDSGDSTVKVEMDVAETVKDSLMDSSGGPKVGKHLSHLLK